MKKLLFLFLPLMFVLASCSDDDFDHAIVGKWQFTSVIAEVGADNLNLEADVNSYLENYIIDEEMRGVIGTIFEFKNNKKLKITQGLEIIEISYSINGKTIVLTDLDGDKSDPVEFEIYDGELILYQNFTDMMSSLFLSRYPNSKVEYAFISQFARKL